MRLMFANCNSSRILSRRTVPSGARFFLAISETSNMVRLLICSH